MIETEQQIVIAAGLTQVWDFASDMRRWADLMPGMREFAMIDADNSVWTLKVGVGGLVRTVKVHVHVDEWAGPQSVRFSYRLEGDPVQGGGWYRAMASGPAQTEVTLHVEVVGSGPLAPMWEAMGRPLLPQLAKGFAGQLRDAIEASVAGSGACAGDAGAALRPWWKRLADAVMRALRPHGS